MITWLAANLINIVLITVIALITGLAIRSLIGSKKAGKSSCGCSCSGCAGCTGCSACAAQAKLSRRSET
ncbi:MAG: FeoB-associated Cys-rich membrane protein [Oscillospiraceae bacterium]|nr:FeoB-associated Cys-rich membrane protein [Oscillospiraceae bacterium]